MTTLVRMVDAVVVTTVWTPPTSLASRDWISPVLASIHRVNLGDRFPAAGPGS
jgi:hypothetical protein